MKIALVGAIDRYNYGDVLFPIITKMALEKRMENLEFDYYGYQVSDLSEFGAYKTKTVHQMIDDDPDVILVVGGEVLRSTWKLTYLFLLNDYVKAGRINKLVSKIPNRIIDPIFRRIMGYKHKYPWIFEKKHFPNTIVIYNTVGGFLNKFKFDNQNKNYYEKINNAAYISVRESATRKALQEIGLQNVLGFPDSAFLMSDFFPKDYLAQNKYNSKVQFKDYIVFQIGKKYGMGNIDEIVKQLLIFLKETNKDIILLPIGRVALHEDLTPLSMIKQEIDKTEFRDQVVLIENTTIYETMSIIANSQLFIGTSLHGNVTALSYGIPSVGLDPRVSKLNYLLQTYSIADQSIAVEYSKINEEMQKSLNIDKQNLIENSLKIKELVNRNFDLIAETISLNK